MYTTRSSHPGLIQRPLKATRTTSTHLLVDYFVCIRRIPSLTFHTCPGQPGDKLQKWETPMLQSKPGGRRPKQSQFFMRRARNHTQPTLLVTPPPKVIFFNTPTRLDHRHMDRQQLRFQVIKARQLLQAASTYW